MFSRRESASWISSRTPPRSSRWRSVGIGGLQCHRPAQPAGRLHGFIVRFEAFRGHDPDPVMRQQAGRVVGTELLELLAADIGQQAFEVGVGGVRIAPVWIHKEALVPFRPFGVAHHGGQGGHRRPRI